MTRLIVGMSEAVGAFGNQFLVVIILRIPEIGLVVVTGAWIYNMSYCFNASPSEILHPIKTGSNGNTSIIIIDTIESFYGVLNDRFPGFLIDTPAQFVKIPDLVK